MLQWIPVRPSEYLKWGLRYVIVLSLATSWAQFEPFYDMLTNVPGSIGAQLIDAAGAPTLNAALDAMVTGIFDFSDRAAAESGFLSISITSVLLVVIGALMACVAILVSAFAKIGLAMAVSIAPIFIATALFRSTSDLFTTWSRFTLGFALIPLVLAGVMGAIIGIGEEMLAQIEGAVDLTDAAGFLIVVRDDGQVPTMVNGLAGSVVATANGIREARMAGSVATGAVSAGFKGVAGAYHAAKPTVAQAASAVGAARAADGGVKDRVNAALEDWRGSSEARKSNIERNRKRAAILGRETSWADRREAGRAAVLQHTHENQLQRRSQAGAAEPVAQWAGPGTSEPTA